MKRPPLEECCKCNCATGKAGAGDGSLYCEDCEDGPFGGSSPALGPPGAVESRWHRSVISAASCRAQGREYDMNHELLTGRELAGYLRVSYDTIRRWKLQGRLPFTRIGGRVLFRRRAVDALLEAHAVPAETEPATGGPTTRRGAGDPLPDADHDDHRD